MPDQTRAEFYADKAREFSPEWDYGVMWCESNEKAWPLWRVSWIVNTGEVYACSQDRYRLLGVVPAIGKYPLSTAKSLTDWSDFERGQTIEQVMKGWAEGDPTKPLSWVIERLGEHASAEWRA